MATKTLSKSQWQRVKDNFKIFTMLNYAHFMVDGYKVSIVCKYVSHNKLNLACYVNEELKGEWFTNMKEPNFIRSRFFPYDMKPLYSARTKTMIKQVYKTKKAINEQYPDIDKMVKVPRIHYRSIAEVKRILEANNGSVELVSLHGDAF
jgi:hypothetical protein